eukprot:20895-Heterococcus_DN1.PRE.4
MYSMYSWRVTTQYYYYTVSTTVFQTFACDVIDDDDALKPQYLRADYSIQCGTAKHKLFSVFAGIMVIIYPIGIPALYGWLLWHNRHKLSSENNASASILSRHKDVSLRPTRNDEKMWPCKSRTCVVVFIAPGTTAQAAVACILANSLAMKADISSETHDSQNAFAIVLILLNVVMIGATVLQMMLVGRRAYTSRQNSVLGIGNINHGDDSVDAEGATAHATSSHKTIISVNAVTTQY